MDRNEMPPIEALKDCYDSWASGSWRDENAVLDLEETMGHIENLLEGLGISTA